MVEAPKDFESAARQLWDMLQRVATHIAAKPLEQREAAFALTERTVRRLAKEMKLADESTDAFVKSFMDLLRQFVTEIDVGGSPQGGRA
jgi:hypothetical protein